MEDPDSTESFVPVEELDSEELIAIEDPNSEELVSIDLDCEEPLDEGIIIFVRV